MSVQQCDGITRRLPYDDFKGIAQAMRNFIAGTILLQPGCDTLMRTQRAIAIYPEHDRHFFRIDLKHWLWFTRARFKAAAAAREQIVGVVHRQALYCQRHVVFINMLVDDRK